MERWKEIERVPAPVLIPAYGPMSGMRILATGSLVSVPFSASLLAEFGAEVIHVERVGSGDPLRSQSPVIMKEGNEYVVAPHSVPINEKVSTGWIQEARNRLSLCLDLNMKRAESKEIFLSLIKQSDVWMENLVWIEKLGITEEMIFEVNPSIVILHCSGFGRPQFGGVPEECERPSYDPIGQAEGGWMTLVGEPEPNPPTYGASYINDYLSATYATIGILMAYYHAQKTGKGQSIDVTQIESMSKCLNDSFVNYFTLGSLKERVGNQIPNWQPAGLFKTKDDDWLYIATYGPHVYARCMKAMGIDLEKYPHHLAGASIEAVNSPLGQELKQLIVDWAASRNAEEGLRELLKYKVPCGIPRKADYLANCEHYNSRGNFVEYEDQTLGETFKAFGSVPKLSKTPGHVWRGAPSIGQDTDTILATLVGYSDDEIDALKGKGIIDPAI